MSITLSVAFVTLPAPALAAGPKPKLDRVEPQGGLPYAVPGGNVEVFGEDLSADDPDAVEVEIGGLKTYALEAEPTRLRVAVPTGLGAGKHPVQVTVEGRRSNRIEVVIRDDPEALKKKASEDAGQESLAGGQRVKFIQLDLPIAESDRGVWVIRVSGRADVPDGSLIALTLWLGTQRIEPGASATVQGGAFVAAFGPYQRQLFAGTYFVEALFNIYSQPRKIQREFQRRFDPQQRKEREVGSDRQPCRVGTPAEEAAQENEWREHFASTIAGLRAAIRELEAGYGSAGRSGFRTGKGGDVDEEKWECWLGLRALRGLPEAERPKRARELRAKKDFLAGDVRFADAKWREWLDQKREEVSAHAKAHAAFADRFHNVRDREAMDRLTRAFVQWQALSSVRSRELYEMNGLPFHARDPGGPRVSGAALDGELAHLEKRVAPEAQAGN